MAQARSYQDAEVKACVQELVEAGTPVERAAVEARLAARHAGRGSPRPETLDRQIAAAVHELHEARRLRRAGRLSPEDRTRIDKAVQHVRDQLTDALADVAIDRDDRHEQYRRQAGAQLVEATARARAAATESDERIAEMRRRLEEAERWAVERDAACRELEDDLRKRTHERDSKKIAVAELRKANKDLLAELGRAAERPTALIAGPARRSPGGETEASDPTGE